MKTFGFTLWAILFLTSSAFAENFVCSDYSGQTTFSVNYNYTNVQKRTVSGRFFLRSKDIQNGEISGKFFNYVGEPDNYAISVLDCSQEPETGYCHSTSGHWLTVAHGYELNLGGTLGSTIVTCHGDIP
ncbi:hypothetical protein SHI21_07920 [Bacteriovorax sp. PP10]|uniref:Uncharacterized protein n=1 Tax=Bacteriovorax antarcticus TaxID=3088717 RepID=A0ABU5VUQ7_9BACT|nr:hypothetical protein [Bacteriovorax sp. PP10]MEA9356123.1 hypothetical protein [Bacteriovorax sp. PP10]